MTTPDLTSTPKFKLKYSSSNDEGRLNCSRKKKKKTEMNEGGMSMAIFSYATHVLLLMLLLLLFFGHGSIDLHRNWSTINFLKYVINQNWCILGMLINWLHQLNSLNDFFGEMRNIFQFCFLNISDLVKIQIKFSRRPYSRPIESPLKVSSQ